ncbi:DUF1045 domain-containing protein [Dyella acidisoli]|uniref:Phosphonate metabolism protein n=1 Tax=Dyella acidisoli TaxID=1867834 RepID=A0ABQ5XRM5_9GAMM|nr:DUF1045 domain-containing protein [Dyella acidisoli]GLQ93150.1 phosphonate metabolism protein [Dyella acidisoli]
MRYAVYFCPAPDSALHAFGTEWLATTVVPTIAPERLQVLLADVRRYGWHATLTAPFELASHASYDDLHRRIADIAVYTPAFELPLQLDTLAGFLALRPCGDTQAVDALAAQCVRDLNTLRAPITQAAWERRAETLDDTEHTLFRQYGYPYVLDRYRFHLTLSAPATAEEEQALCAYLLPKLGHAPCARIDALTVCREPIPGAAFEQLVSLPLKAAA